MARRLLLTLFLPYADLGCRLAGGIRGVAKGEFCARRRRRAAAVGRIWASRSGIGTLRLKGARFGAIAWRMGDSTGAFGAFQWQRPAGALPVTLGQAAVSSPTETLVVEGNYLLSFRRFRPAAGQLKALASALPRMRRTLLPVVAGFLPSKGLVGGSERYLWGRWRCKSSSPEFPFPQPVLTSAARRRPARTESERERPVWRCSTIPPRPSHASKWRHSRSCPGSMPSAAVPWWQQSFPRLPPSRHGSCLDRVQYEANVTWNERTPIRRDNVGELVVSAFVLAGILLLVCVGGGLAVGGLRVFSTRRGHAEITVLHIPR